ncbi:arsenate reductase (glutaredoxin) [Aliikangiella marina]|uniref:Arsenate reductase n=1 Tax=Aliikangiella marina TaxID=1712262 RepID=A0A545TIM3_9GAMM|nr:arsenate reductase (glutaredoxin) [Aliikangiella marina]TQV77072.1 arsenate reductase (glutaredoxin) [Aliikangiella marina]
MASFTIYHNPRCSKSRQTLEILNDKGVDVEIVEYLKTPPSKTKLKSILKALDMQPQDLMRKKEAEYKEAGLDDTTLTKEQQVEKMVAFPKVIERPIVVSGDKAVIGRPPENVLDLI